MHIDIFYQKNKGVSLIEMVVFIVVVSIALSVLTAVYNQSVIKSNEPLIRQKSLNLAQAKMDEVMALKYDAMTPTGGIPACNSTAATAKPCDNTPDSDMNDVDDFHLQSDEPFAGYHRQVTVSVVDNTKRIQVEVSAPDSSRIVLTAERANF